jgi:prophage antirepressor-like protein
MKNHFLKRRILVIYSESKKIRKSIENLDDECKIIKAAPTGGGLQEQWFLTEDGLYELLFISRKPIAKQFKVWVRNIVKEIRLKGKYILEEQLKNKELEYKQLLEAKESELAKYKKRTYEEIDKTGHVYVIGTDHGSYKIGRAILIF